LVAIANRVGQREVTAGALSRRGVDQLLDFVELLWREHAVLAVDLQGLVQFCLASADSSSLTRTRPRRNNAFARVAGITPATWGQLTYINSGQQLTRFPHTREDIHYVGGARLPEITGLKSGHGFRKRGGQNLRYPQRDSMTAAPCALVPSESCQDRLI
jgi:hypothetical protein